MGTVEGSAGGNQWVPLGGRESLGADRWRGDDQSALVAMWAGNLGVSLGCRHCFVVWQLLVAAER